MQLIQPIKCRAFTLVEMLVALAVSSIIIAATYASYEMVATQYKKNMDVADMHTSGRAIMRIIERDIRMAGFEYRDKDAKVTYGTISSPLTIKDSSNKCCDEVTVIYDYFDEDTKKAERIRIRYWAEPHTSNKGSRHRLYKRKDILGQNKKILAKPKLGTKDVMADYIEDLQLVNIGNDRDIYVGNYHGTNIWVYNPKTGKSSTLNASGIRRISAMALGTDGKLYVGSPWERNIWVYDPISKSSKVISASGIQKTGSMAFSSDGKLYVGGEYNNNIWIYDTKDNTSKVVGINVPHRIGSMAFSSDDKLYIGSRGGSNSIAIYDPLTGLTKSGFYPSNISATGSLAFDSNDELYVSNLGRNCRINSYDIKSKRQTWGVTWPCMSRAIKRFAYFDGMALIGNGEIFIGDIFSGRVMQYNRYTGASQYHSAVGIGRAGRTGGITFKNKKTGQESLVTINLILRTKNQYGKDRQFKKKDYHAGNYKLDKTDKYKRDTFSSTVLVRNLAL